MGIVVVVVKSVFHIWQSTEGIFDVLFKLTIVTSLYSCCSELYPTELKYQVGSGVVLHSPTIIGTLCEMERINSISPRIAST